MARQLYPTAVHLADYLTGFDTDGINLEDAIAAAIDEFENRADRRFLAGTADEIRYYDPPTGRQGLVFIDDLACPPTSVVYAPAGGTSETLVLGDDYLLEPANAIGKRQPYTELRFRRRFVAPLSEPQRNSIVVTGRFGWGLQAEIPMVTGNLGFPEDAFRGMLAMAALTLWPQLIESRTGGLLSFSEADVTEQYGVEAQGRSRDAWQAEATRALDRYRRFVL
jgi:hypothetical protein